MRLSGLGKYSLVVLQCLAGLVSMDNSRPSEQGCKVTSHTMNLQDTS